MYSYIAGKIASGEVDPISMVTLAEFSIAQQMQEVNYYCSLA
jgi:hypothetical protein